MFTLKKCFGSKRECFLNFPGKFETITARRFFLPENTSSWHKKCIVTRYLVSNDRRTTRTTASRSRSPPFSGKRRLALLLPGRWTENKRRTIFYFFFLKPKSTFSEARQTQFDRYVIPEYTVLLFMFYFRFRDLNRGTRSAFTRKTFENSSRVDDSLDCCVFVRRKRLSN